MSETLSKMDEIFTKIDDLITTGDQLAAFDLCKQYEDSEDTRILNTLAFLYYYGDKIEQDYEKAKACYERSAKLGSSEALRSLGYFYYYGFGIEKDMEKAMDLFMQSAELGDIESISNIADDFYNKEKYEEAYSWYIQGAVAGDCYAQYMIGVCYYTGNGIEQNLNESKAWLEKAADQSEPLAIEMLEKCFKD